MAATDLLTPGEGKDAINVSGSGTANDAALRIWISAVSQRIDALCGAVVARTVTDVIDGRYVADLRVFTPPILTVTSVTEYVAGVGTVLTAETNTVAGGYLIEPQSRARLMRRTAFWDTYWQGRVEVVYSAGRFASTSDVDAKFKAAAQTALGGVWPTVAGAWANPQNPLAQAGTPVLGGGPLDLIDSTVRALLADEIMIRGGVA